MDIRLNFVNRSNEQNNPDIVIFQKNGAGSSELAIAWLVIRNCAPGDHHPFVFPVAMAVSCSDSWGNYTPQLPAQPGQLFALRQTTSGDVLAPSGPASVPTELQVLNGLAQGAINAQIYRAGRLIALATSLAPQQKAAFRFAPTIWIGPAAQIEEGDVMNSAVLSSIPTEISLLGIAGADIVMTGGGPGKGATPLLFTLENIVYA